MTTNNPQHGQQNPSGQRQQQERQQSGQSTGSGQNPNQQQQQRGRTDDPMHRDRDQERTGNMTEEQRTLGSMPGRQNEDEIDVNDPTSDSRRGVGSPQQRQEQTGKGQRGQGSDNPRE